MFEKIEPNIYISFSVFQDNIFSCFRKGRHIETFAICLLMWVISVCIHQTDIRYGSHSEMSVQKLDPSKRWNWVELWGPRRRGGQRLFWIHTKQSRISSSGCARASANHPPAEQSEREVHRLWALCKLNTGACQQCSSQCQSNSVCATVCVRL